jgi:histidyl-tRNA synthetase
VFQSVRGTHDLLPEEFRRHQHIIETAQNVSALYGYEPISTPIFEFTSVFHRLGETSDVVSKETYTFEDRGGESITLRPEGTAAIVRALISNGLTQQLPLRFFYHGPMFRYDRPQKGRQRQFHQIGIELFGVSEPAGDVESIATAVQILRALNILDKTKLYINSLGDTESRSQYRKVLVEYLKDHEKDLSVESKTRLVKNPLRILDSKDHNDKKIIAHAPVYTQYLTSYAEDFFAQVQQNLDSLEIAYNIDSRLVRGLDYYCHTAFVFRTDELGSQGEVLGGGRYDGLVKSMNGPEIPGIGWAAGIERLALISQFDFEQKPIVAIIPLGAAAEVKAFKLAQELRNSMVSVDMLYTGSVQKRFKRADKIKASIAIIIGDEEIKNNSVTLRDLKKGEQKTVPHEQMFTELKQHLLS